MKRGFDNEKLFFHFFKIFLKIFIPIICGFLPSFIFVLLFVQYGSPISNYIKFLLNFDNSWFAWVAAVIIITFSYFIEVIVRSRKNFSELIKRKKVMIVMIVSFILILALIITQLSLYINFTLGSDILVTLSADKDNVLFTDNSYENIEFKISVTMNPFCSAECDYKFLDVSSGEYIDSGSFNITSIISKTKEYALYNQHLTEGSQSMNRFEVSCKSKKSLVCYTSEKESKRTTLVTMDYDLSEEDAELKKTLGDDLILIAKTLYYSNLDLIEAEENFNQIGSIFDNNFSLRLNFLSNNFYFLNESLKDYEQLWREQKFDELYALISDFENSAEDLYKNSSSFDNEIISNISFYNGLVGNMNNLIRTVEDISDQNLSESLCFDFNHLVPLFNEKILEFKTSKNILNKEEILKNLTESLEIFYNNYLEDTKDSLCVSSGDFDYYLFWEIESISLNKTIPEINIGNPVSTCCFIGECGECLDNEDSSENYPIIFLHGHSISKSLPADYSLDTFTELKEKLSSEKGYLDAGAFIIDSSENKTGGLWGKINTTIIVTASYFFDTYKTDLGETTISSNEDNIDTYTIRLKKIVDLLKKRTNKDKVIIVAHSMGGLVTRRYIQIFGGNDVEKVVLITVPNHGIEDKIKDYCSILGPEDACNDMSYDSVFMNNLNNQETALVPTYNIIGIGCNMKDDTGDGIIKNSSQYLNYATNYYVSGSCNEVNFEYLHQYIVYPGDYPDAYEIISKILF